MADHNRYLVKFENSYFFCLSRE